MINIHFLFPCGSHYWTRPTGRSSNLGWVLGPLSGPQQTLVHKKKKKRVWGLLDGPLAQARTRSCRLCKKPASENVQSASAIGITCGLSIDCEDCARKVCAQAGSVHRRRTDVCWPCDTRAGGAASYGHQLAFGCALAVFSGAEVETELFFFLK